MDSMQRICRAMLAAAAALALAGCSATHVGESWQCPIAQGASCASIADADPAMPEIDDAPEGAVAAGAPLYRERVGGEPPMRALERDTGLSCARGCGPFGWFARLLRLGDTRDGPGDAGQEETSGAASGTAQGPVRTAREDDVAAASVIDTPRRADGTPGSGMRDAPAAAIAVPATSGDGEVREPEVIGRIWIAPFVDTQGVYREAHWVRAVLEPAGWRLR